MFFDRPLLLLCTTPVTNRTLVQIFKENNDNHLNTSNHLRVRPVSSGARRVMCRSLLILCVGRICATIRVSSGLLDLHLFWQLHWRVRSSRCCGVFTLNSAFTTLRRTASPRAAANTKSSCATPRTSLSTCARTRRAPPAALQHLFSSAAMCVSWMLVCSCLLLQTISNTYLNTACPSSIAPVPQSFASESTYSTSGCTGTQVLTKFTSLSYQCSPLIPGVWTALSSCSSTGVLAFVFVSDLLVC